MQCIPNLHNLSNLANLSTSPIHFTIFTAQIDYKQVQTRTLEHFQSFLQLSDAYQLSIFQWSMAALAAFILGLAKGGIKGLGVVIVLLLIIVFGGRASTGILVPMLIAGDIFAVWYYNQHAQWKYLFILLPWMVAGVLLGVWFGEGMSENLFEKSMALIIILSLVIMLWRERRDNAPPPNSKLFGAVFGSVSGFTTMVGNLAGPFSNIYLLAMRLPKDTFIGTAAWLFFIINFVKLPFHIYVWETITWQSLSLNLKLLPILFVGLLAGVWLVKIMDDRVFRWMVIFLTAIGGVFILIR